MYVQPSTASVPMLIGRIQDLNRRTNAAEREAFESPVFTTPTGAAIAGVLRWGHGVEIVERRDRRTRVRSEAGLEGWVANGDVVELRWVRRRDGRYTAPLFREAVGGAKRLDLLRGNPVLVMTPGEPRSRVWVRGWIGWIDTRDLGAEPLLEVYFIDVGQGDGVLIRVPDGRHLLIDGGYTRTKQPTGKSGADFVGWKFLRDHERGEAELERADVPGAILSPTTTPSRLPHAGGGASHLE